MFFLFCFNLNDFKCLTELCIILRDNFICLNYIDLNPWFLILSCFDSFSSCVFSLSLSLYSGPFNLKSTKHWQHLQIWLFSQNNIPFTDFRHIFAMNKMNCCTFYMQYLRLISTLVNVIKETRFILLQYLVEILSKKYLKWKYQIPRVRYYLTGWLQERRSQMRLFSKTHSITDWLFKKGHSV